MGAEREIITVLTHPIIDCREGRSQGASVRRCTPSSPWIPIVRRDPDGAGPDAEAPHPRHVGFAPPGAN